MLLTGFLKHMISTGRLEVIDASGKSHVFSGGPGPAATIRLHDLPDQLYDLFLDRDRQYSCAYFEDPVDDLEKAQLNKQRQAVEMLPYPPQRAA